MSGEAPFLPECPIHPNCPIVGGQCSCGEDWFGATLAVRQALRLGLLENDPFALRLLRLEDTGISFIDAIKPFTRNGDSAETQLAALMIVAPSCVAAYEARKATRAPFPRLSLTDVDACDQMVARMNTPGYKANLAIDVSMPDRVMLCHGGTGTIRLLTPEQEQRLQQRTG